MSKHLKSYYQGDMTNKFRIGFKKNLEMIKCFESSPITTKIPKDKSLDELINLVDKSLTLEQYKKFRSKKNYNFIGEGYNQRWNDCNLNATPEEWLSIYKYSDEYNNFKQAPNRIPQEWVKGHNVWGSNFKNILDFGAGPGEPWSIKSIDSNVNLYLLEANLSIANNLKEKYKWDCDNVHVVTSFQEIKHIKFNYIYSRDVIEHVRNLNEHLDLLYHLGAEDACYFYKIDGQPNPVHVLHLHNDTKINDFWQQFELPKIGIGPSNIQWLNPSSYDWNAVFTWIRFRKF